MQHCLTTAGSISLLFSTCVISLTAVDLWEGNSCLSRVQLTWFNFLCNCLKLICSMELKTVMDSFLLMCFLILICISPKT